MMRIIAPTIYRPASKRRRWWLYAAVVAVTVVVPGAANYLRPIPAATIAWSISTPATGVKPSLSWPSGGQAAVAAEGYGPLDTSGNQVSLATASITKVILALCVLQKQPIATGQTGQTYTVNAGDVVSYLDYAERDGSSLKVIQGEQLTEYQALQALMLPSANNVADSLANWVFGGQIAYAAFAATWLQQHGIDNTHIGSDAGGFDPSTTSTASDLAQLGLLAAQNQALMEIAGQRTAILPVAGTVWNYNTVQGQSGIDGLKTGNNDADPGAFLFTATTRIGDQTIRLSGTVMGASDLNAALQSSVWLAASAESGFEQVSIAQASQSIGRMQTAWGASALLTTVKPVQLVRWKATPVTLKHTANTSLHSGTVGTLKASAGPNSTSTPLRLAQPLAAPTFWWRLTRH